jgi:hypothetical protein
MVVMHICWCAHCVYLRSQMRSGSAVRAVIHILNLNVHSVKFIHLPQFHLRDEAQIARDVDESRVTVIWDVMF